MKEETRKGEIIIYRTPDKEVEVKVALDDETVWLSQKQMSALFQKNVRTINEHVQNIFKEKELRRSSAIRKFRITANDGKSYETYLYNLDVVISVGYRVKSIQGTRFRIWATKTLRDQLISGYKKLMEKKL